MLYALFMGVGNIVTEQIIWKQEKKNSGGLQLQCLLRGILAGVAYLLFAQGVMSLMGHMFGFHAVNGSRKYSVILVLSTFTIGLWNEKMSHVEKKKLQLLGNGVFYAGLSLLIYIAYKGLGEGLKEGLYAFGNTYMARWEAHSSKFVPMNTGSVSVMREVAEILILIIMPLLQIPGCMARKNKLTLGLPITIICAGLWVVYSPQWKDLVFVCISGGLFFYLDSCDKMESKSLLGLGAVCMLFISIPGLFQEKAMEWVVEWNGDWFYFQENLEEQIRNGNLLRGLSQSDLVDNHTPRFKNEEVIQLTMSGNPQKNIYLRGYHCKDYKKGIWEKPDRAFQKACKEHGLQEEAASKQLLAILHKSEDLLQNESLLFEVSYTGIRDKYTYFPYGAGWEEESDEYRFSEDSVIGKARSCKEAKVLSWKELRYPDEKLIADNFLLDSVFLPESAFGSLASGYNPEGLSGEDGKLCDWYKDFVYENYLQVPDHMKNVKNLAEKMKGSTEFQGALRELKDEQGSVNMRNGARLDAAYLVAAWLKNYGSYSRELDNLPKGGDAVEYFLGTSGKGYCTHFASAGTLLLRELGIPARYVVGYVVKPGKVSYKEGNYQASVLDSDGHAWTEVYLENYGWVPVEMTPGYQNIQNLIHQNVTFIPGEDMKPPVDNPPEEEIPSAEENVENNPTLSEEEEYQGEKNESGESQGGKASQKGENSASGTGSGTQEPVNKGSKVWVGVLIVCLLGTTVFVWYRYRIYSRARRARRLSGYLRRKDNKRAVVWIHNSICRKLMKKEHKYRGIRDKELLVALKKEFPEVGEPDWDTYFQVVRRAVYSQMLITTAEVTKCYDVYESIHRGGSDQK